MTHWIISQKHPTNVAYKVNSKYEDKAVAFQQF